MADFTVNTITIQGANFIAGATAGDKLVIDGCDATTTVLTAEQARNVSTRPSSPGSNTTTVALAGSTDNHVYAYAEFIRGTSTGGDFNSFYLYGHMESAPSTIRVIAVASASAVTHIPTATDVTGRTEIQFELSFSATDEVVTVTDTSMYTTRGEFLLLKERAVTTHAEGTPTTGDAQTIYGAKTFMDDLKIARLAGVGTSPVTQASNMIPGSNTTCLGSESAKYSALYANRAWLSEAMFGLNGSEDTGFVSKMLGNASSHTSHSSVLAQKGDREARIGCDVSTSNGNVSASRSSMCVTDNDATEVASVDTEYVDGQSPVINCLVNTVNDGETKTSLVLNDSSIVASSTANNNTGTVTLSGTVVTVDATINVVGDISPTSQAAELVSIGNSTYKFLNAYFSGTVSADTITASHYGEVSATKVYCAPGSNGVETNKIGSSNSNLDLIFSSTVVPSAKNASNIGAVGSEFNNVYATSLHGCIPMPQNGTDAPAVGTIFWASIGISGAFVAQAGSVAKYGQTLGNSTNTVSGIGIAKYSSGSQMFISTSYFSTHTEEFTLLCGTEADSSASTVAFALVMRTA